MSELHQLLNVYLDAHSDTGNGDHYWRADCSCGWTAHRVWKSSVEVVWLDHAEEQAWYDA